MTENEYFWAWTVYLSAVAIFYAVFWYVTSKIPWGELRQLLRIVTAVFLLVPWRTDTEHTYLSPAWLVSAADALLYEPKAFWRAGLALVLGLIVAVSVSTGWSIFRWFRGRKKQEVNVPDESEVSA
jgi:hypothetical protein